MVTAADRGKGDEAVGRGSQPRTPWPSHPAPAPARCGSYG